MVLFCRLPLRSTCSLAIGACGALASAPLATADASTGAPPAPRHVLFVVVDDLKPAIGAFGDTLAHTPAMDALAKRGTVFARAYAQQAVCAASRNSVLTGLRPDSLGVYTLHEHFRTGLQPEVVTLPQYLRVHGYHTESIGKVYHTGHGNHDDARSWSVPSRAADGRELPTAPGPRVRWDPQAPRPPAWSVPDVDDGALEDGRIADRAIAALERLATGESPFFLAVGFVKPHLPFEAPRRYWELHDPSRFAVHPQRHPPDGSPPYAHQDFGELRLYDGVPREGPLDDELARTLIHGYYAATSFMDAQLGRVLAALDRLGLRENTLIVLWGDHGFHLSDLGLWCKGDNFEQAVITPLIISVPGQPFPGGTARGLVELVDLYPTIVDLLGLPIPEHLEGDSLRRLVFAPQAPGKLAVFHQWPKLERNVVLRGMGRAVRTERYRLVEWEVDPRLGEAATELYEYLPGQDVETRNLAGEPAAARTIRELQALLAGGWRAARLTP
jgi:iduronate 2-sulfatase